MYVYSYHYINTSVHMYISLSLSLYLSIYLSIYLSLYIYIYIFFMIHVNTHVCIHIYREREIHMPYVYPLPHQPRLNLKAAGAFSVSVAEPGATW